VSDPWKVVEGNRGLVAHSLKIILSRYDQGLVSLDTDELYEVGIETLYKCAVSTTYDRDQSKWSTYATRSCLYAMNRNAKTQLRRQENLREFEERLAAEQAAEQEELPPDALERNVIHALEAVEDAEEIRPACAGNCGKPVAKRKGSQTCGSPKCIKRRARLLKQTDSVDKPQVVHSKEPFLEANDYSASRSSGVGQPAPPSAPDAQRTEAETASEPCAAEGAWAGSVRPPSAAAPKAGPTKAGFREDLDRAPVHMRASSQTRKSNLAALLKSAYQTALGAQHKGRPARHLYGVVRSVVEALNPEDAPIRDPLLFVVDRAAYLERENNRLRRALEARQGALVEPRANGQVNVVLPGHGRQSREVAERVRTAISAGEENTDVQ
jgi:hypothetical protein